MARDLNFHHLRYFRAVARDGNLTRAAERLHLSQSALSIQIRQLEARLGHELFERKSRQLHLTEAGRIALEHADAIFAAGDELVATLAERSGKARHVLRVGALATLSRNFQVSFLAPILRREDVSISVRSGRLAELLEALRNYAIDVVLTNELPTREAATPWLPHKIAEQGISLIGSPQRIREDDTADTLIQREPILAPAIETSIRADFDAYCARRDLQPRLVAEVDDMAMLRVLTRADIGMAVVPPIVVTDELSSGALVEAARIPELRETFYAVTLMRRFPNPLLKILIEKAGAPVQPDQAPIEDRLAGP